MLCQSATNGRREAANVNNFTRDFMGRSINHSNVKPPFCAWPKLLRSEGDVSIFWLLEKAVIKGGEILGLEAFFRYWFPWVIWINWNVKIWMFIENFDQCCQPHFDDFVLCYVTFSFLQKDCFELCWSFLKCSNYLALLIVPSSPRMHT